jgi:hypothetical protein
MHSENVKKHSRKSSPSATLPAMPLTVKRSSSSAKNRALREDLTSSVPSTFFKKNIFPECNTLGGNLFFKQIRFPKREEISFFLILFPECNTRGRIFFKKKILFRECPYPGTRGRNSTIFIVKTSSPSAGRGTRGSHLFFFSFPCEQQIKSKVHNIQSSQVQYIKMTLWAAHGN